MCEQGVERHHRGLLAYVTVRERASVTTTLHWRSRKKSVWSPMPAPTSSKLAGERQPEGGEMLLPSPRVPRVGRVLKVTHRAGQRA